MHVFAKRFHRLQVYGIVYGLEDMMEQEKDYNFGVDDDKPELREEAARLLRRPIEGIADWRIHRIREDGAIDAHVPLTDLTVMEVPIDPFNVERLIGLFNQRAKEAGGTGQRDAIVAGDVPGEKTYMLDGFHRHTVQRIRGEKWLHSTVEPNLTYEQVVKRQLEYANTHPEIEFARQLEMIQTVWERTPWSEQIPLVLTAFRACQDDYRLKGTSDIGLIDSLSDDDYLAIREWVTSLCADWGYVPSEIRENLASVESFDPELMRLVYRKRRIPPVGRIGMAHVEEITKAYPYEYDMQRAVVDLVIAHELVPRETALLVKEINQLQALTGIEVAQVAKEINFLELKAKARKRYDKKPTPTNRRSSEPRIIDETEIIRAATPIDGEHVAISADQLTTRGLLRAVFERLPTIPQEAFDSWGREEVEQAFEIALVLSEVLGQLSVQSTAEPTDHE